MFLEKPRPKRDRQGGETAVSAFEKPPCLPIFRSGLLADAAGVRSSWS
jgi:hypothetical protein